MDIDSLYIGVGASFIGLYSFNSYFLKAVLNPKKVKAAKAKIRRASSTFLEHYNMIRRASLDMLWALKS